MHGQPGSPGLRKRNFQGEETGNAKKGKAQCNQDFEAVGDLLSSFAPLFRFQFPFVFVILLFLSASKQGRRLRLHPRFALSPPPPPPYCTGDRKRRICRQRLLPVLNAVARPVSLSNSSPRSQRRLQRTGGNFRKTRRGKRRGMGRAGNTDAGWDERGTKKQRYRRLFFNCVLLHSRSTCTVVRLPLSLLSFVDVVCYSCCAFSQLTSSLETSRQRKRQQRFPPSPFTPFFCQEVPQVPPSSSSHGSCGNSTWGEEFYHHIGSRSPLNTSCVTVPALGEKETSFVEIHTLPLRSLPSPKTGPTKQEEKSDDKASFPPSVFVRPSPSLRS